MTINESGRVRPLNPVAFLVVAAILSPHAVCAQAWRNYHNTRFGVTADAPADWKMEPEPENNDGRIFVSPDGSAQLTISGMYSIDDGDTEIALRLAPNDGETITYKTNNGHMFVVSGTKGDRIFYRKYILSCGGSIWNDISLEYPASQKAKYDALVAHVAASLHPGDGYGVGKCK